MTDNLIYLNENNVLVHSDSITINNVAIKNNLTIGNIQSTGQLNVKESIKIDGNINRKMENIEYQNINMNTNIVGNNINIFCKTIDLNMKDMIVSKPQVLLSDGINCTWSDYIDGTIPNNNTNSMLLDYTTVKYNVNFDTVVITNNPSINNTCIITEDSQLASPLYIKFDIDSKLKDYSTNTITDDFDYTTSDLTDFNLDINGSSKTITKVEYKKANKEFNINYSSPPIYKDDIVKLSYTGSLINPFSNIQFGYSYIPYIDLNHMSTNPNLLFGYIYAPSNDSYFALYNKHYNKFLQAHTDNQYDIGNSADTTPWPPNPGQNQSTASFLKKFSFSKLPLPIDSVPNQFKYYYMLNQTPSDYEWSNHSGIYKHGGGFIISGVLSVIRTLLISTGDDDNSFYLDSEFTGWTALTQNMMPDTSWGLMKAYEDNTIIKFTITKPNHGEYTVSASSNPYTITESSEVDKYKWYILEF